MSLLVAQSAHKGRRSMSGFRGKADIDYASRIAISILRVPEFLTEKFSARGVRGMFIFFE